MVESKGKSEFEICRIGLRCKKRTISKNMKKEGPKRWKK